MSAQPQAMVMANAAALAAEAATRFAALADDAIAARGRFAVALAGGSTPAGLYRLLSGPPYAGEVDWSRTLVFFGDERCVPPVHPDSNYRMARETLLSHVTLPPENVFRMAGELGSDTAAAQYAETLARMLGTAGTAWPQLDLVLLGMGDDGHTASLFPGMPALDVCDQAVVWTPLPDYVKPAVPRLTLTLPMLNAARHVIFLVAGAAKAHAVRKVFGWEAGQEMPPAARVRPAEGTLTWLVDEAAAAGLAGNAAWVG